MNTTTRLYQNVLSQDRIISYLLTKPQLLSIMLALAILTSGLSMVYVTYLSRSFTTGIHQTLAERNALRIQWGQLLLEKSTWAMQARVQKIAENELNMMVPDNKTVAIIE